jgi:hypothetical protein
MTRVTLGKSRVREIRPPGSVRAKAKWLSYSTTTWSQPIATITNPALKSTVAAMDIAASSGVMIIQS